MKTGLVITTYNRPDALAVVLKTIGVQKLYPDEIVIADDGSNEATRSLVDAYNRQATCQVKHVWQADEGFRAARVRNLALASMESDYVIFIDGDMLMHPQFVASHVAHAKKGCFLQGSRVLMDKQLTNTILEKQKTKPSFFSRGIRHRHHMLHSMLISKIASFYSKSWQSVRSCNMSFWMDDLIRVNGFDEGYVGWGREDNDIALRLINCGIIRKNIKACAVAYHLYHDERKRSDSLEKNDIRLRDAVQKNKLRSDIGLDRHRTNNG